MHSPSTPLAIGPFELFRNAWHNRALLARLTRREIEARYRGSFLGVFWSILGPLLMLLVYAFVFSVVFETKWGTSVGGRGHFALLLFTGLILFNFFAECLNRSPGLLIAHVSYVKKVVFPLEILPWVTVLAALFNALLSFLVLLAAYIFVLGVPPITALYIPVLVLPTVLSALGLSLFFSSVGVFVRDLQQLMGLLTMVLMFLSPLFYPISAIPPEYRIYVQLSPLTVAIEECRKVLFDGQLPYLPIWALYTAVSLVVAWLGFAWFAKTKKAFADVL